jgi:pSer/pThr/pTyr-binding forkhead associated (FHA) protein
MIGRGSGCQIHINDPKASRQHALLQFLEGQLVITDQGSSNGIYINEEFTHHAGLNHGDTIRIGETVLAVHLSQDAIPTILDADRLAQRAETPPAPLDEQPRAPASHCANCGAPFSPGAKFCGSCGTERPA